MEAFAALGYIGLFFGTFIAATLVPFSSDVLLLGVLAAGCDTWTSVAVATAGNWCGGLTTYGMGRLGKWEWIERRLKVSRKKLEHQKDVIYRYGSSIAFSRGSLLSVTSCR